jgi:hypothetical protein
METFIFWWSIASTGIGVILGYASIYQYFQARKEAEKQKAQVKIWMQSAYGISDGLMKIYVNCTNNKFSSPLDVGHATWSVQSSAFALYQSLYEERCISEEEYKERQKKLAEKLESQQVANKPAGSTNG